MRVVGFLLWVLLAVVLLWPLVRRGWRAARVRERVRGDELVKDPVCQTYVVRSRAVSRTAGGQVTYFCSRDCARRYLSS
jgi:YHS domain-containing protein